MIAVSRSRWADETTAGGCTRVRYVGELRLKGAYRIAEPFLGPKFAEHGHAALEGLRDRLSGA